MEIAWLYFANRQMQPLRIIVIEPYSKGNLIEIQLIGKTIKTWNV